MNEKALFDLYRFVRYGTIRLIDETTEENADLVPSGFNNSIRWNLGHMFVAQEFLMYGKENRLSEEMLNLFNIGTKPSDWTTTPPSLVELRTQLIEQQDQMIESFTDRLNEPIPTPFNLGKLEFHTFGEVFNFSLFHEGLHQGVIKGIQASIKK